MPLAVCIAAARMAVRPHWSLADFESRLLAERGRLDELAVGDLDVRASIALSYRALPPEARQLFRRLGLLTTPDWPAWVADAVAGARAAHLLLALADVHLIEPLGRDVVGQDRYRLHDLVAELVEASARLGEELDLAGFEMPLPPPPDAGVRAVREAARDWCEVERAGLVAAVSLACDAGEARLASALALSLSGFLAVRAYDRDRERVLLDVLAAARDTGLDRPLIGLLTELFATYAQQDRLRELPPLTAELQSVARRVRDPEGVTRALAQSGWAACSLGRLPEAADSFTQAIGAYRRRRRSGPWTIMALAGLARTRLESGRPDLAIPMYEEVLAADGVAGTRRAAIVLCRYASGLAQLGRTADAQRALTEAEEIVIGLDDAVGPAYVDHAFAEVDIWTGEERRAPERLGRSLEVMRRLGNREGIALVLRSTGDVALATGQPAGAREPLAQSLAIWRRLGADLEAARTLTRLARMSTAVGDGAAAATYRNECGTILDALGLDEACLRLPSCLAAGGTVDEPPTL